MTIIRNYGLNYNEELIVLTREYKIMSKFNHIFIVTKPKGKRLQGYKSHVVYVTK